MNGGHFEAGCGTVYSWGNAVIFEEASLRQDKRRPLQPAAPDQWELRYAVDWLRFAITSGYAR
jgi:hypothetical protein